MSGLTNAIYRRMHQQFKNCKGRKTLISVRVGTQCKTTFNITKDNLAQNKN